MESNGKRKGFIKSNKLSMSFYQAAKPSSATVQYGGSKVQPSPIYVNGSSAFVNAKPDGFRDNNIGYVHGHMNYSGDDNVDTRIAKYISAVQARFKHEIVLD
ncbi:hypothetical protein L1049_006092 [Liquidambar formosana]|uniref:Uncharacterized protein n=1 Tax=Liquidambar formosana TaxID=63359 RepID=A0AAP0RGC7_LIQFO